MDYADSERIARLERRVEYLVEYLGMDPADIDAGLRPVPATLPGASGLPGGMAGAGGPTGPGLEPVYDAIRRGKTIQAIKLYRELTGAGLKNAKDAVDEMARGL